MTKKIENLAVLCSGGDSPGMNCAIRAVVRTALAAEKKIWGVKRGYAGLLEGDMQLMDAGSVGNILQRGGTILQTSRCPEFHDKEARAKAAQILRDQKIDGLIVIGGNGSFQGALNFQQENNIPVIGIPGTIDNDISGTEYTIGFDTAVQTAMEAVDKIRDTATSHQRIFLVEVMGRNSEAIALHVGVCTGAESIVFPQKNIDYPSIYENIQKGIDRGKQSSIIIVAEGKKQGVSYEISDKLLQDYKIPSHVCILGHIQRGGRPTALDRFLAAKMGFDATHALLSGEQASATVFLDGKVRIADLNKCTGARDAYDLPYEKLVHHLS